MADIAFAFFLPYMAIYANDQFIWLSIRVDDLNGFGGDSRAVRTRVCWLLIRLWLWTCDVAVAKTRHMLFLEKVGGANVESTRRQWKAVDVFRRYQKERQQ